MRVDPVRDSLLFLAGDTPDHHALGAGGVVLAVVYIVVLLAGVTAAAVNWVRDPAQRSGRTVWLWLVRTLMGAMWFQGSLWKLPLPASGGLRFWTGEMAKYSAFAWHGALVRDVLVPNLTWLGPLVWLTEIGLTVSLTLGLAVRLGGLVGVLFTLNLWFGLYRDPGEWPWTYVFIVFVMALLAVERGGRSLGMDALILRGAWARGRRLRGWRIVA